MSGAMVVLILGLVGLPLVVQSARRYRPPVDEAYIRALERAVGIGDDDEATERTTP